MDKIFAIAAMALIAGNDLIYKRVAGKDEGANKYIFYTLQALAAFIVCIIFISITGSGIAIDFKSIIFSVGIGILSYLTYFTMIKCLVYGNASKNITIYRLNFVVSSILAITFLNEVLTVKKFISIFLCIVAILVFLNPGQNEKSAAGIKLSLLACVLCGLLNTLNKVVLANGVSSSTIIFYRFLTVFIIAFIVMKKSGNRIKPSKDILAFSLASGTILVAAIYIIYFALNIGEVIVVIPITQLSFAFSSVMLFIFAKEKMTLSKIFGICMAVLSIIVIL